MTTKDKNAVINCYCITGGPVRVYYTPTLSLMLDQLVDEVVRVCQQDGPEAVYDYVADKLDAADYWDCLEHIPEGGYK
jgi:hypothetical protein